MKIEALMVGTLTFFTGAAVAQVQPAVGEATPSATSVTAVAPSESKDNEKLRCKRMPVTGSRLGKNICQTESEWAALERQADEIMRDIESRPVGARDPRMNTTNEVNIPTGFRGGG